MSSGKYTKGPWVFETRGYKCIVSKPGEGYITRDVCRMDGSTMSTLAQEANARLIAAAPELLEALIACRKELAYMIAQHNVQSESDGSWLYDYQTVAEADTAIAKAKGEAV